MRIEPTWWAEQDRGFETPCWIWQRGLNSEGYGRIGPGGATYAHRASWEDANDRPVPSGRDIDHLCRNRACVNPDHLEPVTRAINLRRGKTAKLTAAQVAAIRASDEMTITLGKRYGVHSSHISRIRNYRKWR